MNTLRIYIVGVGGQGNVLASKMIGEAALSMGVPVLMSETHGMAQRGGVVESTVVLGALYGAADMPLTKESQMEAIRKNGKPAFVESNLNCFERGFKAASEETAKG